MRDLRKAFPVAEEMGEGVGGSEILQRPMPTHTEPREARLVRLILGDQLVHNHPWFEHADDDVLHVMMEVRQETDVVVHHVQKVLGFFAAMRRFAERLRAKGHRVLYLTLDDPSNLQDIGLNLQWIIRTTEAEGFAYMLPDEHRLDDMLHRFAEACGLHVEVEDTHHFLTHRQELSEMFSGHKQYLMERFYRAMRERTGLLMQGAAPQGGRWNFDQENRKRPPKEHIPPPPLLFDHDLRELERMLAASGVRTMGSVDAAHFPWPLDRAQSLDLLRYFCDHLLPRFGTFQDAMSPHHWAMYHARLSFSMNVKMLSPMEVCEAAVEAHRADPQRVDLAQVEGFIRQIIGWREYMRGVYWARMPGFAQLNFLGGERPLPPWYWTGRTRMACLREAIGGSLTNAYAHHIQRLMVTGNFALLAGVDPDEVDRWYLGIYIDAIEWVEITNTRGMSQFADGGIVGTKPYASSGSYINRMGHSCAGCHYDVNDRTGPRACPFNALYWHFLARNRDRLMGEGARPGMAVRMAMPYRTWDKMSASARQALIDKGEESLNHIDEL